jgi:hypothetical protein
MRFRDRKRRVRRYFDKNVKVAVYTVITTHARAEDGELGYAFSLDRLSVLSDHGNDFVARH